MRILITPGEPAGIGPDIVLKLAQQALSAELVVIADPSLLEERARKLNLPIKLSVCNLKDKPIPHQTGQLKIIPVALSAPCQAGQLNADNAAYVIETLTLAATACLQQEAHALVTGPVHKSILNKAGIAFTGHTEFLAQISKVKQTVMLFVVDQLKVALATTHVPLAAVAETLTPTRLETVLHLLHQGLKKDFGLTDPRLLVCGLNPHAGEDGLLGMEEKTIISPVITACHKQGMNVSGPLPADTIFTQKYLQQADAILAMYHDQALPLIKFLGFDRAVNVTLGLPFIRTSVDHGTALDIAGTGEANPGSLLAAVQLAINLVRKKIS